MIKRTGLIKFKGLDQTIIGDDIHVGQKAPDFTVQKNDWSITRALKATRGKVRIIAAVPSLDTPVCDRETRRFNVEAANLGKDITILVISTDLPVAQARWCGAAGVDQVETLSDAVKTDFGKKYGTLMNEVRLLRRAIFVVDKKDTVVYAAYMATNGDEPEYQNVMEAAKKALAE